MIEIPHAMRPRQNDDFSKPWECCRFNRDISPILSDRCYFCHGPDTKNPGGWPLDSREEAQKVIDSGDLIKRILSDDPDIVMPPPGSKVSLSASEKEALKQWINEGAEYQGHTFRLTDVHGEVIEDILA